MREMILAEEKPAREAALKKLLPYQRGDFEGLFKAMKGLPVTIRLLDPPLHEFLPHDDKAQKELAGILGVSPAKVKQRVGQLHEMNPMLGHRGLPARRDVSRNPRDASHRDRRSDDQLPLEEHRRPARNHDPARRDRKGTGRLA